MQPFDASSRKATRFRIPDSRFRMARRQSSIESPFADHSHPLLSTSTMPIRIQPHSGPAQLLPLASCLSIERIAVPIQHCTVQPSSFRYDVGGSC